MIRGALALAITTGSKYCPARLTGTYLDVDARASCPLGAAYLGTLLGDADVEKFLVSYTQRSPESMRGFIHEGLLKSFPQLGWSLDALPVFSRLLGADAPPGFRYKSKFNPTLYSFRQRVSLFATIAHLHDELSWEKDAVSAALKKVNL
jgi:hypothetical protein